MKKIISTIILGIFAVVLLLPAVALAQPQRLNECCKITGNLKIQGLDKSGAGVCVIGRAGGSCVVDGLPVLMPVGDIKTLTDVVSCNPTAGVYTPLAYEEWGLICLVASIHSVTNWIFYLLMVFVVVMVVVGGATYMLASGDPEKAKKGKSIIIYGIVGFVIALLARLIPSIVKIIVGM